MQFHHSKLLKKFPNLIAGFTTKDEGNLAFHVEDSELNVMKNHKLLANRLSYDYMQLVHMKQIHTKDVVKISSEENFTTPPTCDALITNEKNKPLMVMVADCAPILLFDPECEVIAAVHAGRAGAFANILGATIERLRKEYGSKPKNILALFGPMIGVCCYEVGAEIFSQAQELHLEYAIEKRGGHFFLDIQKILQKQSFESGILEKNCEFLNICTSCSTQSYYSYRAEGKTGRFAGVIMQKA